MSHQKSSLMNNKITAVRGSGAAHIGISIIIPVHSRFDNVRNLISSIHYQSEKYDVEVIVVDDCCMDVFTYEGESNNINLKIIRNNFNRGANISRNIGFNESNNEIVHFHDSDDLLASNWINAISSEFSNNSEIDLVVTPRISESLSPHPISFFSNKRIRNFEGKTKNLALLQRVVNIIGPLGGVTFRRKVVENFSFHDIRASQDWLMYDEALAVARSIKFIDTTYFVQRSIDKIRISTNLNNRIRGYISASRLRFTSKLSQKLFSRLYCTYAKNDIHEKVTVRFYWIKMRIVKVYILIKMMW